MKKLFLIYTALLFIGVTSCKDLTLEPKGILGEPELFGNDFGVKKYFAAIYNSLPFFSLEGVAFFSHTSAGATPQ